MSIIVAIVDKREAVLATDTLGVSRVAPDFRCEVSKSFVVPHLRLAFGVMGPQLFATNFLVYLGSLALGGCDAILDNLAEHASRVTEMAREFDEESDPPTLVTAIGWSLAANRPRGAFAMNFTAGSIGDSFTGGQTRGFRAAPLVDASYMAPEIDVAAKDRIGRDRRLDRRGLVVEVAKEQRKVLERAKGPGWMGGRVIMHTITRNEISSRQVHEWPQDLAGPVEADNVIRLGGARAAA